MKRLAVTGHRPPRLELGYAKADREFLLDFARPILARERPDVLLAGAAQGWDQACMYAALELGVPVIAVLPFVGQDATWPKEAREEFATLLARCDVRVVCEGCAANWKYLERDRWMIDQAERALALFDGVEGKGGTAWTVAYARKHGVPVLNVWDEYEAYRETQSK